MRILELRNIFKTYDQGKLEVPVLKNVSLSVEQGEYVAIMGPSGSGKTTLMNLIGCLDSPTSGEYLLEGEDLSKHSDLKLSEVRLRSIGFVFQSFYLLSRQSAIENVALPLLYAGVKKQERLTTAQKALERVGLGDRTDFKPTQLSGGQCQRVAIARAIVNNPKILLADEPTGALDTKSGEQIMEIFQRLHEEGVTIIMITHEADIARHAQRILHIRDGRLTDASGNFLSPETEPAPAAQAEVMPVSQDTVVPAVELHKSLSSPPQHPVEQVPIEQLIPEPSPAATSPNAAEEAANVYAQTPDFSPSDSPKENAASSLLEEELEQALAADASILPKEAEASLGEPVLEDLAPEETAAEPELSEPELSEPTEEPQEEAAGESDLFVSQEEVLPSPEEALALPQEEPPEPFLADEELFALLEGAPAESDPLFAQLGAVGSERLEPTGDEIVKEPVEEESFADFQPEEAEQLSFLAPEEDAFDLSQVSAAIDEAEHFMQLAFDVWGEAEPSMEGSAEERSPEGSSTEDPSDGTVTKDGSEGAFAEDFSEKDTLAEAFTTEGSDAPSEGDLPEGRFGTPISTNLSLTFGALDDEALSPRPGDEEGQL